MLPKDTSMVSLLAALAFACFLGSAGYEGYKVMSDKADAQAATVADFQEWKRQYTKLLPLEDKWNKTLRPFSEAKDLYSLHELLGDQPSSNADLLLAEQIERMVFEGKDLGAQRVCLGTGGGAGMLFVEKDFQTLMTGLDALAQRADIQMGAIELSQDNATARATVAPLCLLLRDDEGGKKHE